jgi:hypothetical protein
MIQIIQKKPKKLVAKTKLSNIFLISIILLITNKFTIIGQASNAPCNTYSSLVTGTYSNLTVRSSTGLFGDEFSNKGNLIDASTTNSSTWGYLVGGSAWIEVEDNDATGLNEYPAGSFAGFLVDDLALDLLGNTTITTYLGTQKQDEVGSGSLLGVLGILNGTARIGIITTLPFDRVRISYSALGVAGTRTVYYAEILRPCAGPTPDCNVSSQLISPTYPAIIEPNHTGLTGLTLGTISNTDRVVNSNTSDFATIFLPVGVLATGSISVKDLITDYPAGNFAGFEISNASLLGANLLSNTTITTYLNGNPVPQETSNANNIFLSLPILTGSGREIVGFVTTKPFDEIRFTINQIVGINLGTTNVYNAIVKPFCAGLPLNCNTTTNINNPDYPTYINFSNTGITGAACLGCSVTNTESVIDADQTNYSSISLTVGILSSGSLAVKDIITDYPAGTFAGFDIENASLIGLSLFNGATISTYLNGNPIPQETSAGSLISLKLLSVNRQIVGFTTTKPFDEIKITVSNVVGLNLGVTRVYNAVLKGASTAGTIAPVIPSISSNVANVCPIGTVDLNALVTSTTPTGAVLVWFENIDHTGTATTSPTATSGTYYAFYFDQNANCYSLASTPVTVTITDCTDTDGDGTPDITDLDDDNDGILDTVENAQGNGDTDSDGIPNREDLDSDNDGISDLAESGNAAAIAADTNSDGTISNTESPAGANGVPLAAETTEGGTVPAPKDTDGDGKPDAYDLDSDNDGINDLAESGNTGLVDLNSDGVVDGPDADGDGINDSADANDTAFGDPDTTDSPKDTDGDGIADFRDLDSDNDGINDLTESGNTGLVDANSDGVVDGPDADGDGIHDSADANDAVFGDPETSDSPVDTDSDGIPNFRDLDSDGDGINDVTESGSGLDSDGNGVVDGPDADGDGIKDAADANDGVFGDPDSNDTPNPAVITGTNIPGTDTDGDGITDPFDGKPNDFGDEKDTDGDGIPNSIDLDDDNDGILDTVENAQGNGDTDGDGIPNREDLDSDNDGISDLVESGNAAAIAADTNSDGTISNTESPAGANGVPLAAETSEGGTVPAPKDTDGDGKPDAYDLDSDNDGINDLTESGNTGLIDMNSDGIVDGPDADGDGINDSADANDTTFGDPDTTDTPKDTDGDGIADFRDLDSDNDGINDLTESGNTGLIDMNSDGVVDGPDADGDGIQDSADANDAVFGDQETTDSPVDTDSDGIPNFRDLDSDGDGINDVTESGSGLDPDGNGVVDGPDADGDGIKDAADANDGLFGDPDTTDTPNPAVITGTNIPGTDTDGDGITDPFDGKPNDFGDEKDTDSDGIPNSIDLDDDNDGILDTVENAQGNGDTDGDGIPNREDLDSDNDGISDLVESGNASAIAADTNSDGTISNTESPAGANGVPLAAEGTEGGTVPSPKDTDGDGKPDAYDLDSDNDGINDLTESGNTGLIDMNSDGVVDGPDADGDGINDSADANDTTFGDPDTNDTPKDTDGDGIADFRDLDSDNDGINDLTESGNNGLIDMNSDGVVDGPDADGDGIQDSADANDAVFGDPETTDIPKDTDGDGVPDFRDLDSDNDGINDLTESGNTGLSDTNSDGVVDGPDADGDGIKDSADVDDNVFGDPDASDTPIDTDADGIPNFRDLDSDGDGTNDIIESGSGLDSDGNGVVDGPDADGDGINDAADANDMVFGDPDANDTPNSAVITGTPIPGTDTDGDGITDNFDDLPNQFGDEACLIEIGGGVYTDITPLDGVINGLPYIVPNLYMTLIKDNIQVAVTPFVLGKYKFTNVEPGTYKLVIGTNILGSLIPSLPIGITYTSEGGTAGDGSVDGVTAISVTCKGITYSSGLKVSATASYLNNNFGVNVLSGPLPINLISFKAAQMNETVNLTWKTSNETNFSHYEIQHSADAKEFGTIATLSAENHQFVDTKPLIGENYYRLKMVDLDGKSQLSKTVLVNFEKGASFVTVENPARNGAFNVISNLINPQFTLLNSMGQRTEIQVNKTAGDNYSIQTNNFVTGIYYLNIVSEGKLTTKKVLLY